MELDKTPECFIEAEAFFKTNHKYACPTFSYTAQEPGSYRCPMVFVKVNNPVEGEGVTAEQDGDNLNISIGKNFQDVAEYEGLVVSMHIHVYGKTQFDCITQGELDGLANPEEFLWSRIGIMDWLHVADTYQSLPCVNGVWFDYVKADSERGLEIEQERKK